MPDWLPIIGGPRAGGLIPDEGPVGGVFTKTPDGLGVCEHEYDPENRCFWFLKETRMSNGE